MATHFEEAKLLEPINQPGHLWLDTAIAQFKFMNDCCQQAAGCCARTSVNMSLDEFFKRIRSGPGRTQ